MLFILWYSFLLILLNPTKSKTEDIISESPQEDHLGDKQSDLDENVAVYEENDPRGQTELRDDVFGANSADSKSSDEIRLGSGTYSPQDETNDDLKRTPLTLSHESEFKESPEMNFIGHSPGSIKQKPAHQVYTEAKSKFYLSSGNGNASPTEDATPEDWNQLTQSTEKHHLHSPDPEAKQFSESQLIEPEDTMSEHDRTEGSFTEEINEETRLNPNGESFVLEDGSTEDQAEGDVNEKPALAETRESINRELPGKTELTSKEHAEAKDAVGENSQLNQSHKRMIIRESAGGNESNPKPQSEVEDGPRLIHQNGLDENSYIDEDDPDENVDRDESEEFNSSVEEVKQENMNNSEDKLSNINSRGELELSSKLFQRTSNNFKENFELFNSEGLPESKTAVKKNLTRSNNTDTNDHFGSSKDLVVKNIDSDHTIDNFSLSSENDKPIDSYKDPYSIHRTNYQSKSDNSIQENTELLDVENNHGLINSYEVKTDEKEFATCGTSRDCLLTATDFDDESADVSSKVTPNTQKEDRIRDVGSDSGVTSDSKLISKDSAHEESLGSFENIEFNLQEFVHIIKTDKNFQAFIYNSIILYVPVLICDALLWIVIVKLARHIRRQLVFNPKPKVTESLVVHQSESEEVDTPIGGVQGSSCDLLGPNSKRVWYPPS